MESAGAAEGAGRGAGLLRGVGSEQQAGFVELFFDLVVVFALNRLVAHTAPGLESPSTATRWATATRGLLLILPLIWVWTITAFITARLDPRRAQVQIGMLVTALGLLLLGAAMPEAFDGTAFAFAGVYVVLQAGRALVLGVALRGNPLQGVYLRALCWFCLSAVPWLLGAAAHGMPRILLWSLAIAIDYGSAGLGWPVPGLGRQRVVAWAEAPEYLANRYRQLLLIALGETILAVGIAYTDRSGFRDVTKTLALVITFLTAVLLWRIYFYRAGEIFGAAVESAENPASLGRFAAGAHLLMIMGVVGNAVGHELVQAHPLGHTHPSWVAVMVGGPVLYVAGRALLERVVFSRVSLPRLLSIGALLLLAVPLAFAPPLVAVAAVAVVLLVIAAADARRAAGLPLEAAVPPS